ncbi:MAG TPA: class I SAM-dependent methyltransferase [Trichormus sp. M33_DOE_039]|nr:class I SAM-dependent methyltransferase [Trichormus sp. M33_DOE_039]
MIHSYEELNKAQEVSETDTFTIDRYRQFFHFFHPDVKKILDVGCNTGRGGKTLKELNRELQLIGLDCVNSRLEKLPCGVYDQKVCSYSTNVILESSSIDAIVAGEFIEHLYPDDVTKTLYEFYRLLKPSGQLLLTTPNPNYLLLTLTSRSVLGGAHVSQHYPADLVKHLKVTGFDEIKIFGSGKVSRYLGQYFPWLRVYGSYLVIANKVT